MSDQVSGPFSPQPAPPARETLRFEYVPRDGLLGLTVYNFFLNVVTLGFYRFWAKTAVRRHIWSCVHINGEPLEYTGRGMELFKGAIIVFVLFVLPYIAIVTGIQIYYGPEHPAAFVAQYTFVFVIFILWGMAIYRARRYQLSRTLWRGIRGALTGSPWSYTWLNAGAQILKALTLGWSTPAMNLKLQSRIIGEMRFGEMPFAFQGLARPLYRTYTMCWFLTVFLILVLLGATGYEFYLWFGDEAGAKLDELFGTDDEPPAAWKIAAIILGALAFYAILGLIYAAVWAIYSAREMSVFANYTGLDRARFHIAATAGSLIMLALGNLMIFIFTLGIGNPYVQQRNVRYIMDRMTAEGLVDIDRIMQSRQQLDSMGEGLADAFDVGGL